MVHTFQPSAGEADSHEFQASQSYLVRHCLKKIKKIFVIYRALKARWKPPDRQWPQNSSWWQRWLHFEHALITGLQRYPHQSSEVSCGTPLLAVQQWLSFWFPGTSGKHETAKLLSPCPSVLREGKHSQILLKATSSSLPKLYSSDLWPSSSLLFLWNSLSST